MKLSKDKIIGGVCGGIAEEIGVDPWIIQILWAILTLGTSGFPGALIYIILWIILPEK